MELNSKLFNKAKESKVLLKGLIPAVIMAAMMYVGSLLGMILIFIISLLFHGSARGLELARTFLDSTHGMLINFIFPLLICFFWVKLMERRKVSSLGLKAKGAATNFVKGFAIGFVLFSSVTLLMYIFGVVTLEQGLKVGLQSIKSILFIIPFWAIQSSTEEVLSRGWLMHVIGAKYTPMQGFVVSSLVFGYLHISNPGVTVLSIINIVLVGFMFGLYVIYTEDLWGACGIHTAWNFAQGNIFGFKVSGLDANEYSLIRLTGRGPSLLTGGSFGPEASLFASIVIIIFTLILLSKIKAHNNKKLHMD